MAQIGEFRGQVNGSTIILPIHEPADVDITSVRIGRSGAVGCLPFFQLSDNPAYPASRISHPLHGIIAPHSSASMLEVIESWADFAAWPDQPDREYWRRIEVGEFPEARHGIAVAEFGNGASNGSNQAINSFPGDGLVYYPTRDDGIPFGTWVKFTGQADDRTSFGFASQPTTNQYPTQYVVHLDGSNGSGVAELVYDALDGTRDVLDTAAVNLDSRVDSWLEIAVARFASTGPNGGLRIHINDASGGRLAVLEDTGEGRLNDGGYSLWGNKYTDGTTTTSIWHDLLYYIP